jgi:hypothetical protein
LPDTKYRARYVRCALFRRATRAATRAATAPPPPPEKWDRALRDAEHTAPDEDEAGTGSVRPAPESAHYGALSA